MRLVALAVMVLPSLLIARGGIGAEGNSLPSSGVEGDTTFRVVPRLFLRDFRFQEKPSTLDLLGDLGIHVRGRGELGGEWSQFRPCDRNLRFRCNAGLLPKFRPDISLGVQVRGTLFGRLHVDVDYDEAREFSAANRLSLHYQGLEGEFLRRLEVGDVSLDLPPSRYLTRAIPSGNFGLRAEGRIGSWEVQTVWAQQNGDLLSRQFHLRDIGGRRGLVQEDTLIVDDADYVKGQFLFLVDPREIAGYPHIDVLSLDRSAVSPWLLPGDEPIQLYRFEDDAVTRQQVEGYIQGDAVATIGEETVTESGWFRYLQPGADYFVHPSGLWVGLRRPLSRDEMLAVTYVTVSGDTVGDYNPERIHNRGGRPQLRLLKASGGNHQPGRPTWDLEMHQVYRVSGSGDVEPASVDVTVSLGEPGAGRTFKRGPRGEDITLLKLFGLDEESPTDKLDPIFVYKPSEDSFQEQPPVAGTLSDLPHAPSLSASSARSLPQSHGCGNGRNPGPGRQCSHLRGDRSVRARERRALPTGDLLPHPERGPDFVLLPRGARNPAWKREDPPRRPPPPTRNRLRDRLLGRPSHPA